MRHWIQKQLLIPVALLAVLYQPAVHAVEVQYSVESINASDWRYLYTLTNDSLGGGIDEFTIYFDRMLYTNLVVEAAPQGWDSLVVQPDAGIPADGFFDSLALIQGITLGETLGGFSISFTYLGLDTPGPQPFEIVDVMSFNVIDSGVTAAVPEPQAYFLLLAGLGLISLRARSRKVVLLS